MNTSTNAAKVSSRDAHLIEGQGVPYNKSVQV